MESNVLVCMNEFAVKSILFVMVSFYVDKILFLFVVPNKRKKHFVSTILSGLWILSKKNIKAIEFNFPAFLVQ